MIVYVVVTQVLATEKFRKHFVQSEAFTAKRNKHTYIYIHTHTQTHTRTRIHTYPYKEQQVFFVGFSLAFSRFPRKSKNRLNTNLLDH